jgi:heat shock protein HslJ
MKKIMFAALLAVIFVGCGSSGTTTYTSQPVEAKDGQEMQLSDGQTLGISGNNNDVQAIAVKDGSTYVYCKAGDTCNPIMYSTVTTTNEGDEIIEDDDNDDNDSNSGGM